MVERATMVVLVPPAPTGAFRGEVEAAGLVTVLLERGLSDLEPVVPYVQGTPTSPGLARALVQDLVWTGTIAVSGDREALDVELTLCDPAGACAGQRAAATAAAPWLATSELLAWAATRMHLGPAPNTAAWWAEPLSADEYAVLMAGRSAAVFYGLRDPVKPELEGDVKLDPMARAVFIDPGIAEAHWLVGRRFAAEERWQAARESFTRAAMVAGGSPVPRADEATALGALGRWGPSMAAWEALDEVAPGDPRFFLPRAEAALRSGDPALAERILTEASAEIEVDPEVVALRYAVAEALNPIDDHDPLLLEWQEADPADPEPVRRRIADRVRSARYREAWDLLPVLAARDAQEEADAQALGLGIVLQEWEGAATAAEGLGQPEVAARIRARGLLEADPGAEVVLGADPVSRVVAGRLALEAGRPEEALAAADAALKVRRWMPEALALRAEALETLGRRDEAAKARRTLRDADPEWG